MKESLLIGAALCCGLMSAAPVWAAVYPNEDFENNNYTVNQSFTSKNSNWTNNLSSSGSGTDNIVDNSIVTLTPANGTKVLQVTFDSNHTRAVSSLSASFDHPSGKVSAGADVMIPTSGGNLGLSFAGADPASQRLYLSITGSSFSLSGAPSGSNKVKDGSGGTPGAEADVWYHIAATMNIDPTAGDANVSTFDLTVTKLGDGSAVGTLSGDVPGDPTSINQVFLYTNGGPQTVYFDNMFFHPVPEPASLGLLTTGGLLLLARRSRE